MMTLNFFLTLLPPAQTVWMTAVGYSFLFVPYWRSKPRLHVCWASTLPSDPYFQLNKWVFLTTLLVFKGRQA